MKQLAYIKTAEGVIGYTGSEIAKKETNDCVVRAMASSFDMTYDDAHKFVSMKFQRKERKGTKNFHPIMQRMSRTPHPINGKTFSLCDVRVSVQRKTVYNGKPYVFTTKAYLTVNQFVKQNKEGTYLIGVKGHVFTLKDGKVIGNTDDSTKIKRRVLAAYKIN